MRLLRDIEGSFELGQNTLWAWMGWKAPISNITRKDYGIKFKFSGYDEEYVQLTKREYVHGPVTTSIKVKISENIEGEVHQNKLVHVDC